MPADMLAACPNLKKNTGGYHFVVLSSSSCSLCVRSFIHSFMPSFVHAVVHSCRVKAKDLNTVMTAPIYLNSPTCLQDMHGYVATSGSWWQFEENRADRGLGGRILRSRMDVALRNARKGNLTRWGQMDGSSSGSV